MTKTAQQIIDDITSMMNTIPNATETGRAFGKTATAFRAATGQRLRMSKAPKTYTIHRGTVRSAFALYHHVMPIYRRHTLANEALGKATAAVIESEKAIAARTFDEWQSGKVAKMKRVAANNAAALRAAQSELKSATARADEARTMHLVQFVPPYVPAKASRVYPALKTCTSPRRAFAWQVKTGRLRHDPTIAAMYPTTGQMLKWTGVKITIDGHEAKGFADDEFRPAAEVMSDTSFASMVGVPFTVR